MNRKKICIVGGTGFVGGHLLRSLSKRYQVIVLSRNPSAQREHWVVPHVRFELADVYDSKQLARHFDGAVAVINLVGILHEAGSDGVGFRQAHVTLVERCKWRDFSMFRRCMQGRVRAFICGLRAKLKI